MQFYHLSSRATNAEEKLRLLEGSSKAVISDLTGKLLDEQRKLTAAEKNHTSLAIDLERNHEFIVMTMREEEVKKERAADAKRKAERALKEAEETRVRSIELLNSRQREEEIKNALHQQEEALLAAKVQLEQKETDIKHQKVLGRVAGTAVIEVLGTAVEGYFKEKLQSDLKQKLKEIESDILQKDAERRVQAQAVRVKEQKVEELRLEVAKKMKRTKLEAEERAKKEKEAVVKEMRTEAQVIIESSKREIDILSQSNKEKSIKIEELTHERDRVLQREIELEGKVSFLKDLGIGKEKEAAIKKELSDLRMLMEKELALRNEHLSEGEKELSLSKAELQNIQGLQPSKENRSGEVIATDSSDFLEREIQAATAILRTKENIMRDKLESSNQNRLILAEAERELIVEKGNAAILSAQGAQSKSIENTRLNAELAEVNVKELRKKQASIEDAAEELRLEAMSRQASLDNLISNKRDIGLQAGPTEFAALHSAGGPSRKAPGFGGTAKPDISSPSLLEIRNADDAKKFFDYDDLSNFKRKRDAYADIKQENTRQQYLAQIAEIEGEEKLRKLQEMEFIQTQLSNDVSALEAKIVDEVGSLRSMMQIDLDEIKMQLDQARATEKDLRIKAERAGQEALREREKSRFIEETLRITRADNERIVTGLLAKEESGKYARASFAGNISENMAQSGLGDGAIYRRPSLVRIDAAANEKDSSFKILQNNWLSEPSISPQKAAKEVLAKLDLETLQQQQSEFISGTDDSLREELKVVSARLKELEAKKEEEVLLRKKEEEAKEERISREIEMRRQREKEERKKKEMEANTRREQEVKEQYLREQEEEQKRQSLLKEAEDKKAKMQEEEEKKNNRKNMPLWLKLAKGSSGESADMENPETDSLFFTSQTIMDLEEALNLSQGNANFRKAKGLDSEELTQGSSFVTPGQKSPKRKSTRKLKKSKMNTHYSTPKVPHGSFPSDSDDNYLSESGDSLDIELLHRKNRDIMQKHVSQENDISNEDVLLAGADSSEDELDSFISSMDEGKIRPDDNASLSEMTSIDSSRASSRASSRESSTSGFLADSGFQAIYRKRRELLQRL